MMIEVQHPAARLAAAHPDSTIPCPLCAASVKGANLDRHLGKVHRGSALDVVRDQRSWRGPERLIVRPLIGLPVLAVIGIGAAMWGGRDPDETLVLGAACALGLGLILVGLVLSGAPLFHGRLSMQNGGVVLSHTLGLRRRRLDRIDSVEAGSAYIVRSSGTNSEGSGGTTSEEKAGIYLRLRSGRRYITVRCKQSAGFRKTWVGWEQGRRSRRWHITLNPPDFVALQYALADRSVLSVRAVSTP